MKKLKLRNVFLFVLYLFFLFAIFEMVLQALIKPDDIASGRLGASIELPPYRIIPRAIDHLIEPDWDEPLLNMGGKEQLLKRGDIDGIWQEDPMIGYAPARNRISQNKWWESNNIGARKRKDVEQNVPPGKDRVLMFGDSFVHGFGVKQEETISYYLEEMKPHLEVVNLGVNGYSVSQSYLRFQQIKELVDYDHVLLFIVPAADFWREINISRWVGNKWTSYKANPRFIMDENGLSFIPPYYPDLKTMFEHNQFSMHESFREHLKKYDRMYSDLLFKEVPFWDRLVTFRLLRKIVERLWIIPWQKRIQYDLRIDSEQAQIVFAVIEKMQQEIRSTGKEFTVIALPASSSIAKFVEDKEYQMKWNSIIDELCRRATACVDLLPYLLKHRNDLDKAYDNRHYGPRTNRLIAGFLEQLLLNKS